MNTPQINVTPLIDVLLVLLIIFMVVSPLKPSAFRTRVPAEQLPEGKVNPQTIVVTVNDDLSLSINNEKGIGSVEDTSGLLARLKSIFQERSANGDVSSSFTDPPERQVSDAVERTVFIKAPMGIDYGRVAKVVDAVTTSGAFPISLQIDRIN
jgi:biopolymer transport protein TolR